MSTSIAQCACCLDAVSQPLSCLLCVFLYAGAGGRVAPTRQSGRLAARRAVRMLPLGSPRPALLAEPQLPVLPPPGQVQNILDNAMADLQAHGIQRVC